MLLEFPDTTCRKLILSTATNTYCPGVYPTPATIYPSLVVVHAVVVSCLGDPKVCCVKDDFIAVKINKSL